MKKVSKDQAASKIKASNALEVSLLTVSRDLPDSQKRTLIEQFMRLLRDYQADNRDLILCAVKEK